MIKKNWKKIVLILLLLIIVVSAIAGIVYATIVTNANLVTYDKDGNTIMVNEALDELYSKANGEGPGIYWGGKSQSTVEPGDKFAIKVESGSNSSIETFIVGRIVGTSVVGVPLWNINRNGDFPVQNYTTDISANFGGRPDTGNTNFTPVSTGGSYDYIEGWTKYADMISAGSGREGIRLLSALPDWWARRRYVD